MSLARLIGRLRDAGLDPAASEFLDVLWLACRITERTPKTSVRPTLPEPEPTGLETRPAAERGTRPPLKEKRASARCPEPPALAEEPDSSSQGLYPQGTVADDAPTRSASPFAVPAANALPDQLRLMRALKPFARRYPFGAERELDEILTVERSAATGRRGFVIPAFRPRPERWYDADLVIEDDLAIQAWRETLQKLRGLMIASGAFRDVRLWQLHRVPGRTGDEPPRDMLERVVGGTAQIPAKALTADGRRRLILFATHGAAPAWQDGRYAAILETWRRQASVALLHLLPEHRWPFTALGEAPSQARAQAPGLRAAELAYQTFWWLAPPDDPSGFVAVPAVPLDAAALAGWARMQMGAAVRSDAFLIARSGEAEMVPAGDVPAANDPNEAARAVAMLRDHNPEAFRLAVHLAPSRFTLPVARLVQEALLGGDKARPDQLGELLLSGLVVPSGVEDAPIEQRYFAVTDAVREILLASLSLSGRQRLAIDIKTRVSQLIADTRTGGATFTGLVEDPNGPAQLPDWAEPFAHVVTALERRPEAYRPVPQLVPEARVGVSARERDARDIRRALLGKFEETAPLARLMLAALRDSATVAEALSSIEDQPEADADGTVRLSDAERTRLLAAVNNRIGQIIGFWVTGAPEYRRQRRRPIPDSPIAMNALPGDSAARTFERLGIILGYPSSETSLQSHPDVFVIEDLDLDARDLDIVKRLAPEKGIIFWSESRAISDTSKFFATVGRVREVVWAMGELLTADQAGQEQEIARAQRALRTLGLYPSVGDGIMGPRTLASLRAFQKGEGLPETLRPGTDTLNRLFDAATRFEAEQQAAAPSPTVASRRQPEPELEIPADLPPARITFYRHGQGDCLLIETTDAEGTQRHVLVNCGLAVGAVDRVRRMDRVVTDVLQRSYGRLDGLILTGSTTLQTYGLPQLAERSAALWQLLLGWWENPRDKLVAELRSRGQAVPGRQTARDLEAAMTNAESTRFVEAGLVDLDFGGLNVSVLGAPRDAALLRRLEAGAPGLDCIIELPDRQIILLHGNPPTLYGTGGITAAAQEMGLEHLYDADWPERVVFCSANLRAERDVQSFVDEVMLHLPNLRYVCCGLDSDYVKRQRNRPAPEFSALAKILESRGGSLLDGGTATEPGFRFETTSPVAGGEARIAIEESPLCFTVTLAKTRRDLA